MLKQYWKYVVPSFENLSEISEIIRILVIPISLRKPNMLQVEFEPKWRG